MKRYDNLDGLRTFSAIGIILMHIMANTNYTLPQNVLFHIIGNAGLLVELFFMISAFGMCCGYYERIKDNKISLDSFYKKRYLKILPFFAFLTLVDVAISGVGMGYANLIEGFSNITLMYGLFPNSNITVIGVGWALGVIFAFYLLFPFFVFMLWNKKRGWFFLLITISISYVCAYYFTADRSAAGCNLARWLCYFVAGGMIYLHREHIENIINRYRWIALAAVILISVAWYITPESIDNMPIETIKLLILFVSWMCYAISVKSIILANPFTKFMSGVSFEIYLAHMAIFRVAEKVGVLHLFKSDLLSYMASSIIVISVVTVFAIVMKKIIEKMIDVVKGFSYGRKKA